MIFGQTELKVTLYKDQTSLMYNDNASTYIALKVSSVENNECPIYVLLDNHMMTILNNLCHVNNNLLLSRSIDHDAHMFVVHYDTYNSDATLHIDGVLPLGE